MKNDTRYRAWKGGRYPTSLSQSLSQRNMDKGEEEVFHLFWNLAKGFTHKIDIRQRVSESDIGHNYSRGILTFFLISPYNKISPYKWGTITLWGLTLEKTIRYRVWEGDFCHNITTEKFCPQPWYHCRKVLISLHRDHAINKDKIMTYLHNNITLLFPSII